MAGGLGGLGGFGNILGAIGQSLLTSPRENPFQGFPTALQSVTRLSEDAASRNAMAIVAEKLGVPRDIAANPQAMSLFIEQLNKKRMNDLTNQYLNQSSSLTPPGSDVQPGLSVPGRSGGLDGPGGLGGAAQAYGGVGRAPSFTMSGGRGGSTMVSPRAAVDPVVAGELPPHQAALLNAIAKPESGGKYNIRYTPSGGVEFAGFSTHPGIMEPTKGGQRSSAAGRYQFTKTTWDSLVGADTPFTPENQDRAAILLAQRDYRSRTGRDLDADLRANGMTPQIAKTLAPTWEGLRNPGSALAEYNASYSRYTSGALNQRAPQMATANADVFAAPGLNINYVGDPKLSYGRTATANAKPFDSLVVHHTATPDIDSALSLLRKGDPARGGQSFGYHFYVDKDGSITQGAPLSARTNHVAGSTGFNNASAIGISLVGSGETTPAQEQAAAALGQRLATTFGIQPTRIAAHGEIDKGHQENEGRSLAEQIRASVSAPGPIQLASADPSAIALPSGGMRMGQGEPSIGPSIGQSGAPLNQVAAGGRRTMTVPLPTMTMPEAPSTPAQAPVSVPTQVPPSTQAPPGQNINATRAWAEQNFSLSLKRIAVAEQAGLKGVVEAEKAKLPLYTRWLEPSDAARRVAEAGLTGTPLGRAVTAGLDPTIQQSLAEQQIPGYRSPGSREEEQRTFQRNLDTQKFGLEGLRFLSAEQQQEFLRNMEKQKFGLEGQRFENTKEQQAVRNQQVEAARRQQRDIATESHAIQQQPPQERVGAALNSEARAPNIRAGLDAETARIASETTARGTATALTREAEAATNAGRMAARLMPALAQARDAYGRLKDAGTGQFGGIGPSANNPAARAVAARLPEWTPAFQNEVNRQRFDSAMAAIRSAKTAVDLKGQGPVSNFERVLAGADLPDPASVSPKVVEDAFARLEQQLNSALELDRQIGLHGGQQPGGRATNEPSAGAAPARSNDGWTDFGNGVRVRRK
jgi:muramidase (phage lysozyme)